MFDSRMVKFIRGLVFIWLNAPNVVRFTHAESLHQNTTRIFQFETSRGGPLLLTSLAWGIFREERDNKFISRGLHTLHKIREQSILVLIRELIDSVSHFSSIMFHSELGTTTTEMFMSVESTNQFTQKFSVSIIFTSMHCRTHVVKNRKDARRSLGFDQVTHNLIVKILDRCPTDTFFLVFFLFSFKGQLDEVLLELFVHKIDTKLLETVMLEDLKTINVQDTNHSSRAHSQFF
mmetsp:Transcript_35583/g.48635  ORF Transcript_35583/g.48635 Transcript_35583/m.48635 type:complete len:234 (-) Transcript_35583:1331-2032(-)